MKVYYVPQAHCGPLFLFTMSAYNAKWAYFTLQACIEHPYMHNSVTTGVAELCEEAAAHCRLPALQLQKDYILKT